jgi:hypothetical protein
MLDERGFALEGADAQAVGKSSDLISRIFTPAKETRVDERGGCSLETGWRLGVRYRVEGSSSAPGCHVAFTAIHEDPTEHGRDSRDGPQRDLEMELELVRRLAPAEAERIEARGRAQTP